jgi:hypothetical protein
MIWSFDIKKSKKYNSILCLIKDRIIIWLFHIFPMESSMPNWMEIKYNAYLLQYAKPMECILIFYTILFK